MPQLKASPLQIEGHIFLKIELNASEKNDAVDSLSVGLHRSVNRSKKDPLQWRLILSVRFGGETDGKQSLYWGELKIAGFFRVVDGFAENKMEELIRVTGASIMYGACREMLANLTARSAHGMISLPSVSFVEPKEKLNETVPQSAALLPRTRKSRSQKKS